MTATVFTEWNTEIPDTEQDAALHEAFATFALDVVAQTMPAFFDFLNANDAQVVAGLHIFSYLTPGAPQIWVDVPAMANRLNFLPWAEPHETAH